MIPGAEFALALEGQCGSRGQNGFSPFQQVGLTDFKGGDVIPPRLKDAHLHCADIVDSVECFQQAQRVAHHLRVPLRVHQNADAVFQIDNMQHIVGYNAGVPGSESLWHPAGEVQPLFHQHDWISAVLLSLGQLFHHKCFISIGAVSHLLIEILQILRGVLRLHAQRPLHLIGRKLVSVGALLGIR